MTQLILRKKIFKHSLVLKVGEAMVKHITRLSELNTNTTDGNKGDTEVT